jgi:iron complex outermembrane recepter protein
LKSIFGAFVAATLLSVNPAYAQDAVGGATTSESKLEEIVVTALKREQGLQEVPASISAISGGELTQRGVTNIEALQSAVPNISLGDTFGLANLFVRGLGLNTVFANVDPSVTLYSDGAVISQPGAQLFSFFDLQRVEVLRGPQGTLYGRNSTGGTINLISARPTEELSGYATATAGNYGLHEIQTAISGNILPGIDGRIASLTTSRNGFGINETTGHDVSDENKQAVRAQLRMRPSDDLELRLIGDYGRQNDAGNALFFKMVEFPDSVLTDPSTAYLGGVRSGFPTGGPRNYASNLDPTNKKYTWSVTGIGDYNLTKNITFTNTLNYRQYYSNIEQDLDLSSVITSIFQEYVFHDRQFSEDMQVNVDLEKLKLIGGFYYLNEKLIVGNWLSNSIGVGEFPQNSVGNGRRVFLNGVGTTNNWALYWNARYDLLDNLTLKAGGRYNQDRRKIDNDAYIWFTPTLQVHIPGPDDARKFIRYTNEAGLEFRPTQAIMMYYTYSEGFKAGTGELTSTDFASGIINPETIVNHEVGIKSSFDGGRLTVNLSAYRYVIDNVQLDKTLPLPGGAGFVTKFENAASQTAHGVELDLAWRPISVLRGTISAAYQHTAFGEYKTVLPYPDPTLPLVDIKGNPARQSPELAAAAHVEYDIPTGNDGLFTLSGGVSSKSRQYFSEFKLRSFSQGGYAIADAQISYAFPGRRWTAAAWVRNIGDRLVESANYALSGTSYATARAFLPPRTFGVTVGVTF